MRTLRVGRQRSTSKRRRLELRGKSSGSPRTRSDGHLGGDGYYPTRTASTPCAFPLGAAHDPRHRCHPSPVRPAIGPFGRRPSSWLPAHFSQARSRRPRRCRARTATPTTTDRVHARGARRLAAAARTCGCSTRPPARSGGSSSTSTTANARSPGRATARASPTSSMAAHSSVEPSFGRSTLMARASLTLTGSNQAPAFQPAWSPDDGQIAYVANPPDPSPARACRIPTGAGRRSSAPAPVEEAQQLAELVARRFAHRLPRIVERPGRHQDSRRSAGTDVVSVYTAPGLQYVTWSPDGTRFAFTQRSSTTATTVPRSTSWTRTAAGR